VQNYPQPEDDVYPSDYYQPKQHAGQPRTQPSQIMQHDKDSMKNGKTNDNDQKKSWTNRFRSNDQDKENISDRSITAQVLQSLRTIPDLSNTARSVDITTDEGVVTLNGRVAIESESKMIESLAKTIPGVRGVINNLKTDSNT
jgi:osmotically-inducible protein OsmY